MNENPMDNAALIEQEAAYTRWDDQESFDKAMEQSIGALKESVESAYATNTHRFQGIDTNTSVRDGFNRDDYEYFRPGEMLPKSQRDAIAYCMTAYDKMGFIKNIIDIMAEFGSQGVCITHPDKETEAIYNAWFAKVEGQDRSERFLNTLYKAGNVIVKRFTARYNGSDIKNLERSIATPDLKKFPATDVLPDGELPIKYKYYNPCEVELLNPTLAVFSDKYFYAAKVSSKLKNSVKNPKNALEKLQIDAIPNAVKKELLKDGAKNLLLLDPSKTDVYHYKKDDWKAWANPILYSVLDDIFLYRKCRMADLAALDGAVSHIRLWKLGDLEHKILPNKAAIAQFSNMLMNVAANGSVFDLIWNPAIELQETSTNLSAFLDNGKYNSVLQSIYAALGYPQMMTGSSKKGGMSDNFLQIKTLVERLNYGRNVLDKMWKKEIGLVRAALKGKPGFNWKIPAKIAYEHMSLTDEATQTKLVLDMYDRDLISKETAQNILGSDPDLERARILRELPDRKLLPKVSPYHDSQPDLSLEKIFAQRGAIVPSEVGLKLAETDPKQEKLRQLPPDPNAPPAGGPPGKKKPKGKSGQGRPKTSTDKTKRKQRIPLVASELIWAKNAYQKVSDFVTPIFLEQFAKSNIRKFTLEESEKFEEFKIGVISNIGKMVNITDEVIIEALNRPFNSFNQVRATYLESIEGIEGLTLDDKREIYCIAYLAENCDYDTDDLPE